MDMYTEDKETEKKVEKEQQMASNKAGEVVETARKVKNVHLPSTERVERAIERGEQSLETLQKSERGQQLDSKGQQVIEDVKRLLEDQKALIQKNEGDLLQNILRHGQVLTHSLSGDPALKGLFENWNNITHSILNGGDAEGLVASGGELWKSLKNTEEFLDLVAELISMMKILVAEKSEQIVEGAANTCYQAEKDMEREKVVESLRATLSSLSSNYIWCDMVQRGKLLSKKSECVGEATKGATHTALEMILETENSQCLAEDIKMLLQRIVGESISVAPLFENAKAAWHDAINNKDLSSVVYELGEHMHAITETPALADDACVKRDLRELLHRSESELKQLKENEYVVQTKAESRKIMEAIKNEPVSRQLASDAVQLWNDVKSDRPGELIDPELLASVRKVVVPMFLQHLEHVPIPPIHGTGEFLGKYEYTIENIHVSVPALIPENIHIRLEYDIDADPVHLETKRQRSFVFLEVKDMQIHLHDVAWSFSRSSVPRLSDSGRIDVDTSGHGVGLKMKMEIKGGLNEKQVLDVLAVRFEIDKWDVKVSESKHNFIYETLSTVFKGKIKREVQHTIEQKLKEFGAVANEQLMNLFEQAKQKSQELSRLASAKKGTAKETWAGVKSKALSKTQAIQKDESLEETTEEVKESGKNLITLAAEKATQLLTRQQQKLAQRKSNIMLGHQRAAAGTLNPSSATLGSNLSLSLDGSFDSLNCSTSIPPTPPSSPINSAFVENGVTISDASVVSENMRGFEGEGEEILPNTELIATEEIVITPPSEEAGFASTGPTIATWAPSGVPDLGYQVFPDVPSISDEASDKASTSSNFGDEANTTALGLQQLKIGENGQPRIVNSQGVPL